MSVGARIAGFGGLRTAVAPGARPDDPKSGLGPRDQCCDTTSRAGDVCQELLTTPPGLDVLRDGPLPTIIPLCRNDIVQRYGSDAYARANAFDVMAYMSRGKQFSPRAPFSTSGVKGAGDLELTLQLAAAAGVAQGNKYLVPMLLIEVMTSNNIPVGLSNFDVDATFEDGQPFALAGAEITQARAGYSAFLVLPTRTLDGGAFPTLVELSRDLLMSGPGVSIPLTAAAAPNDATAIVPTNGIRSPERTVVLTVTTGGTGTEYRLSTLSPAHLFYNAPINALLRGMRA
jgi:hypothetical protein